MFLIINASTVMAPYSIVCVFALYLWVNIPRSVAIPSMFFKESAFGLVHPLHHYFSNFCSFFIISFMMFRINIPFHFQLLEDCFFFSVS